jgi:anti-anti-sigma factor
MELDPTIVVFAGEYDVGSKASLRSLLDSIAEVPDLVLDFRDVTFIDSTCVTELLRMHTIRITNSLPRETILMGKAPIRRLFEVLDLYRVFNVIEEDGELPHDIAALQRVEYTFRNSVPR